MNNERMIAEDKFLHVTRTEETYLVRQYHNALLVKTNMEGRELKGYVYVNTQNKSQEENK